MYEDHFIMICPYSRGIAKLLDSSVKYVVENDKLEKDYTLLFISSKIDKKYVIPRCHLHRWDGSECLETIHLGHFFTNDLREIGDSL